MPILVAGSIATDHLMTFPGRFVEQLLPDQLDKLSLSFLVDELVVRRGGVAANICFGIAALGGDAVLVGAVGDDFADYRSWLDRHGVDTDSVTVSDVAHTARFTCTTDADQNQLASFYPGAMSEARDIELTPVIERVGGVSFVVVSPDDPEAMLRHAEECRQRGHPFVADPSQQLALMAGPSIRALVDGALFLVSNDYEAGLILAKTGWTAEEVLDRVGHWIVTRGGDGSVIRRAGAPEEHVPVVPGVEPAEPTGVGDAFRAGFLVGVGCGLPLGRSAQVGSLLAAYVLETVGTQEYEFSRSEFLDRLAVAYGEEAAAEVDGVLPDPMLDEAVGAAG